METSGIEAMTSQSVVDRRYPERQRRSVRSAGAVERCAKRCNIDAWSIRRGKGSIRGHGNITTQTFPLCSILSRLRSSRTEGHLSRLATK